jgi:hypothetical protein
MARDLRVFDRELVAAELQTENSDNVPKGYPGVAGGRDLRLVRRNLRV